MYYRARYYDPANGRFTQRDPIGLAAGINQYAYVVNDPVNLVDPEGETPMHAAGAAVGAVAGLFFQAGMDLYRGKVSSFADYAGAVVGGAAGGAAAVSCGPACAGAAAGAASNFTTQAINGWQGQSKSLGDRAISLATDTALGAIGGKVAGVVVPIFSKKLLSNSTKGSIGEGLTEIGLRVTGQNIVQKQASNGVGKSTYDFLLEGGKFVESKFGTASLSKTQRAAQKKGADVDVQSWNYPTVSGLASAGPSSALASELSFPTSSYFSNMLGGGGAGGQTMSGISPRP